MRKCVKCYKKRFFWDLSNKNFGNIKPGAGKSRSLRARRLAPAFAKVEDLLRNISIAR